MSDSAPGVADGAAASGKRRETPEDDQREPKRSKKDKRALAEARSEEFLASLKLDKEDSGDDGALVPVEGANDVWCLEDVVTIADTSAKNATMQNVVLSREVMEFWDVCIANAERNHVCAKGSPGVGKSTTFCYVIRALLRSGKRVIYLYRTPQTRNFYHVWKMDFPTEVYPEAMSLEDVANQYEDGDTYYLCDAGKTQDSCDPGLSEVKAIINAAADEKHWGGSEFEKVRTGEKNGRLLTFPMMTKKQIFVARDKFPNPDGVDLPTLEDRHRRFGAVPRHLFSTEGDLATKEKDQDNALGLLNAETVKLILTNNTYLNGDDGKAPKSSLVCITGKPRNYLSTASFVSDLVQEKVAARHMKNLWNEIGAEETFSTCGHLFESYIRNLFVRHESKYRCRNAVGLSSKEQYKSLFFEQLGGCTGIRRTHNMIEDCKNGDSRVIFYSFNESEPLVDFMYKRDNKYYAIQVTIGRTHDCDDSDGGKLDRFLDDLDLQDNQELNLVYAVPSGTFNKFVTQPVTPGVPVGLAGPCYIFHAEIPQPQ